MKPAAVTKVSTKFPGRAALQKELQGFASIVSAMVPQLQNHTRKGCFGILLWESH
jgi:hypothetical protein